MEFFVFHDYNRLVRRGVAKPLMCPRCDAEYVVRLGAGEQPELQCFMCNSRTRPGLDLYSSILAIVKEHFGD